MNLTMRVAVTTTMALRQAHTITAISSLIYQVYVGCGTRPTNRFSVDWEVFSPEVSTTEMHHLREVQGLPLPELRRKSARCQSRGNGAGMGHG